MPPSDDTEAQAGVEERQFGDTGEEQRGIHAKSGDSDMSTHGLTRPSPRLLYILTENYGDPSGKLWSMHLTEAKQDDDQITEKWTEDTGGVLVFVSLKPSFYICSIRKPVLKC